MYESHVGVEVYSISMKFFYILLRLLSYANDIPQEAQVYGVSVVFE